MMGRPERTLFPVVQAALFAGLLAGTAFLPLAAAALELSDFAGKSIQTTYSEIVHLRNGGTIRNTWRDELYVSTQGRIFHKFHVDSNSEIARVDRELISDTTDSPFRLAGDLFVRDFANHHTGVHLHEEIHVTSSKPGASCTIDISRPSAGIETQALGQSCRIVAGNIVGH